MFFSLIYIYIFNLRFIFIVDDPGSIINYSFLRIINIIYNH